MKDSDPRLWEYDYLLIQRSLLGHHDAWETVYNDAYPRVLHTMKARNHLRFSETETIDIVHEAFLRCYLRRDRFHPISRFYTWVCGFARYISLEVSVKQRKHEEKCQALSLCSDFDPYKHNPERCLTLHERNLCLWIAYTSLSYIHRILIAHYVLGEYSALETQKLTGVSFRKMHIELENAVIIFRRRFIAARRTNPYLDKNSSLIDLAD